MPAIVISRANEYANRARSIQILIDDVVVDKISNGEVRKIHVEQGLHKVKAKIDWCSSHELTVDLLEHETVELELSAFKYASYVPLIVLVVLLSRLALIHFEQLRNYLLILLVPVALTMLYFLTLGRNQYLRLRRISTDRF